MCRTDGHEHSHATEISSLLPALEGFDFIDSLDKVVDRQTTETVTTLIPHSDTPSLQREHLSLFELVRYDEVTHYAVSSGFWSSPSTWHNGVVPAAGAKVLIPVGVNVRVDDVIAPRIATVRVDGTLSFSTTRNTELKVDTVVVTSAGTFQMGTAAAPIARGVTARLLITDNGEIDRAKDPFGISRGLISHGNVTMYGSEVTSYVALSTPALAGAPALTLKSIPVGWNIGDTIVLAATVQGTTQNEVRTIAAIIGNNVVLNKPLTYNHLPAASDLEVHVANVTRNAVIESETTIDTRRGHVMFMHNPDVNIGYAGFYKLGRTDKSQPINDPVVNADWTLKAGTGTNPRARYSVHFHRTGTSDAADPASVLGSAVVDSPGWGFVNHSSYVDFTSNVAFDVNGAAFATEVGDEIGGFYGNLAIGTAGTGTAVEANARELINDFGFQGDGFWFQGGGVSVIGNVSAGNQASAFFYYTKALSNGSNGRVPFSTDNLVDASIANGAPTIAVGLVPIRAFNNNVGYSSHIGLTVRYHLQNPTHTTRSYIENSKFWNNETGITLPYTENTTIRNVTILNATTLPPHSEGINGNIATKNNIFENLRVAGYFVGIVPARKGSTVINGGSWNNTHDVLIYTAAVEDRKVVITGVPASTKVTTVLETNGWGPPATTFFVKDTIILNYGPFVNQQLFFNEQKANYIPFPTVRADMPLQYIGLTNQQLWDRFGVALGGGIATSNAVTVPGIIGLVAPRLV